MTGCYFSALQAVQSNISLFLWVFHTLIKLVLSLGHLSTQSWEVSDHTLNLYFQKTFPIFRYVFGFNKCTPIYCLKKIPYIFKICFSILEFSSLVLFMSQFISFFFHLKLSHIKIILPHWTTLFNFINYI